MEEKGNSIQETYTDDMISLEWYKYCKNCIHAVSDQPECNTWDCKKNTEPEWDSMHEYWCCEDYQETECVLW